MQLGSGDDKVAIEGSGELKGDLLSGTYTISSGEADAAVIDVTDYDTKAVQDGIWKGTYTISGAPVEDEDGNVKKNAVDDMAGRDSGGEGQNPLYVALLASFAQIYRINLSPKIHRNPTLRLVVLDEAFSKMDAEKVASCIALIRGLGFQAIISATNDKIQNYLENVDKTFVYANPNKRHISIQEFEKTEFAQLADEEEQG